MTNKLLLIEKQDVLGFMTDFYQDDNGELYMTGAQIGRCLGYANPRKAISEIFNKYKGLLKGHYKHTFAMVAQTISETSEPSSPLGSEVDRPQSEDGRKVIYQRRKVYLFDEQGVYLIAFHANTEKALKFQEAVANVLKNLRKGYQVWLLERERSKATRRTLTDAIKEDYPDSPHKRFMYKNFTDLAYRTVFGKTAKQLKEEYGDNIRDKLSDSQLKKLKAVEGLIENYIALGYGYDTIKSILTPMLE